MAASRVRFWLNLALVIATSYIIIWYIFNPSSNQCQMTFMMEPPKFIPVPVSDTEPTASLSSLKYLETKRTPTGNNYKLFMYSELGFPMEFNIQRDLRDSMPVLFVPGNAGSYQQVRSIASTCIRYQLQSLDAFKFVFYTIDFRGQLSGINGQLIEDQTQFVHKALKQIISMHPTETNGVIIIGHSVGGFISKALFTIPGFDTSSVPLMISLASPLTKPFLVFDDKMRDLYDRTNKFWNSTRDHTKKTISVSISGGRADRLVPTHLSLDSQYDISLTTNSIRDVWLTTDHVSITWCKELMQKLAHMLSALMDKKHTRLIDDRDKAIRIIHDQLLSRNSETLGKDLAQREWKTMRPHTIAGLGGSYTASRSKLIDAITILNVTSSLRKDLLVWIEHIGVNKDTGVVGCKDINVSSTNHQLTCLGRAILTRFATSIPSRRFEPRKTIYKLKRSDVPEVNYIVLDFAKSSQGPTSGSDPKVPESITLQETDLTEGETIYIPSTLAGLARKLSFIGPSVFKINSFGGSRLTYKKFKVDNLREKNQFYKIKYESANCPPDHQPNSAIITFSQNGYLSESLLPISNDKNPQVGEITISSLRSTLTSNAYEPNLDSQSHLEFYIEGNCDNHLKIEFDLLGLTVYHIQTSLSIIMTLLAYLVYLCVINNALKLKSICEQEMSSIQLLGFLLIYLSVRQYQLSSYAYNPVDEGLVQQSITLFTIFLLSLGSMSYLVCIIKRMVDLATIANNTHTLIMKKFRPLLREDETELAGNDRVDFCVHQAGQSARNLLTDIDWILISLAAAGSIIFSEALMTITTLFIVIKLGLSLEIERSKRLQVDQNGSAGLSQLDNRHCCPPKMTNQEIEIESRQSVLHELIVSIAVMSSLALISNIPRALLRLDRENSPTNFGASISRILADCNFLVSAGSLVLVKLISDNLHTHITYGIGQLTSKKATWFGSIWRFVHLGCLIPISQVNLNLSCMNFVLVTTLSWLFVFLTNLQIEIKPVQGNVTEQTEDPSKRTDAGRRRLDE